MKRNRIGQMIVPTGDYDRNDFEIPNNDILITISDDEGNSIDVSYSYDHSTDTYIVNDSTVVAPDLIYNNATDTFTPVPIIPPVITIPVTTPGIPTKPITILPPPETDVTTPASTVDITTPVQTASMGVLALGLAIGGTILFSLMASKK